MAAASDRGGDEPPEPRIGWRGLYVLVLGGLALSIALLSLLSWVYR